MTSGCNFTISDRSHQGISVLALEGELDIETSPRLAGALSALPATLTSLVLDVAGLSFLDSTGLTVLVNALKRLQSAGGDLKLVGVQPNVRRVLEITALDQIFCPAEGIYETSARTAGIPE